MSDPSLAQELAAWLGGTTAALGAIAVAWSKLSRNFSADRAEAANVASGQNLYDLLSKENARMAERNKSLETKADAMLLRLHDLEVVHVKLQASESENQSLKIILQRKDEQLSSILAQQQSDRQEYNQTILSLKRRIEHFEQLMATSPAPVPVPEPIRRLDDLPMPGPLNFQEET